uniref:Uncharacterized protein n=1 Tax=Octopus bimaculoides TaxID=37653 RepID=A0A0L8HHR7_OCTBM
MERHPAIKLHLTNAYTSIISCWHESEAVYYGWMPFQLPTLTNFSLQGYLLLFLCSWASPAKNYRICCLQGT